MANLPWQILLEGQLDYYTPPFDHPNQKGAYRNLNMDRAANQNDFGSAGNHDSPNDETDDDATIVLLTSSDEDDDRIPLATLLSERRKRRERQEMPDVIESTAPPAAARATLRPKSSKRGRKKQRTGGKSENSESDQVSKLETQQVKDRLLKVGDPVYAPFPGKDPEREDYYWGVISRCKTVRGTRMFNVNFKDGDVLEKDIPSTHIHRLQEALTLRDTGALSIPNLPPSEYMKRLSSRSHVTPKEEPAREAEDHSRPCGKCSQCVSRRPCGACHACKNQQDCFQTTCSVMDFEVKTKFCPALPEKWAFYFDKVDTNTDHCGLWICRGRKRYRSFETACLSAQVSFQGFQAAEFYSYVGLSPPRNSRTSAVDTTLTAQTPEERPPRKGQPWTYAQLVTRRCKKCTNCTREPCGHCENCRSPSRRGKAECIRRVCHAIGIDRKAQRCEYLPPGWRFYFTDVNATTLTMPSQGSLDGLVLLAPNSRQFWSMESAIRQYRLQFSRIHLAAERFYKLAGIHLNTMDLRTLQRPRKPLSKETIAEITRRSGPSPSLLQKVPSISDLLEEDSPFWEDRENIPPNEVRWNPAMLYEKRCRSCAMCVQDDCGKCYTCRRNQDHTRRRAEVCIRKMCLMVDPCTKQQPVPFFPQGWNFYFSDEEAPNTHKDLKGLTIVTPGNEKSRSIDEALGKNPGVVALSFHWRFAFYEEIGVGLLEPMESHPLLGLGYWHEWIRADGSRISLQGTITKAERSGVLREAQLTVTYTEASRMAANRTSSAILKVLESESIEGIDAWHPCIFCQEKTEGRSERLKSRAPFHLKWRTPDTYLREMVKAKRRGSETLVERPRLELTYNCFRLVFTVKLSSIPNSGDGVFVSVRPAIESDDAPSHFWLNPGELLDFGVYAPFQEQDYRKEHGTIVKNFIHNYKVEDYSFDAREKDYIFDITDDWDASLNSVAKQHVPPYVNEISSPDTSVATVHAKTDPEGALHYLLGHADEKDGALGFPADGSEHEIFMDYGTRYETVRIRRGYSRSGMDANAIKAKLETEEREYMGEMETFSVNEIVHSLHIVKGMLASEDAIPHPVLVRMIVVTLLLKIRSERLFIEFQDQDDDASFCDNGLCDVDLEQLVREIGLVMDQLCRVEDGKWANMMEMHQAAIASKVFQETFAKRYPDLRMEKLPPHRFQGILCDTAEFFEKNY